jgi:Mor family transcriptional regulator
MSAAHKLKPATTPPAIKPDLVDRVFDYLFSECPGFRQAVTSEADVAKAKQRLRDEFGGEEAWVRSGHKAKRDAQTTEILRLFNGRNASEVARRIGTSRATVYRKLKQEGK